MTYQSRKSKFSILVVFQSFKVQVTNTGINFQDKFLVIFCNKSLTILKYSICQENLKWN